MAIKNNDIAKLKSLLADTENITNPFQSYSVGMIDNALTVASQIKNPEVYKLIIKELHSAKERT